jgi:hypothetical protein
MTSTGILRHIVLTDLLVFLLVYFLPAFSHMLPVPLYLLDPMRIIVFAGYLFSRNEKNAFFLALTIPIFSMLVSGHPPFFKAFLISIELSANILLFIYLQQRIKWIVLALFVSIVSSKVIYYALKFVFLKLALIDGSFISTSVFIQLGTVLFITILLSFFLKRERSEN